MSNHLFKKTKALLFILMVLQLTSCSLTEKKENFQKKTISVCLHTTLKVKTDFEQLKTYIFLICKKDTLDELIINECYANVGKLQSISDSLSLYTYQAKGGIGIERNRSLLIFHKNKLVRLFDIVTKDNFSDSLFSIPTQERECKIEINGDELVLNWMEFQNKNLTLNKQKQFSISNLLAKKEVVAEVW